ncbi:MAG: helix-turn-helix domain-containing protein [Nitrospinaceae bacterium]|nr:helix-turn-helix domain-containing protein [Nitrospinaceae bacterium]
MRKKMTQERKQLGARLREVREYLGLSQEEVAKKLRIPRTALSQMERGQRRVDTLELKKMAGLYKHPISYFIGDIGIHLSVPRDLARKLFWMNHLSEKDVGEIFRFADYLWWRAKKDPMKHKGER